MSSKMTECEQCVKKGIRGVVSSHGRVEKFQKGEKAIPGGHRSLTALEKVVRTNTSSALQGFTSGYTSVD